MSRARYTLDNIDICTNCKVGRIYVIEKCTNCNALLCEPCFQFVGCCTQENIIDKHSKKLRIPSIPNKFGVIREHPSTSK
jgi:hypothetical protein